MNTLAIDEGQGFEPSSRDALI